MKRDRVIGGLLGVSIGDALGVPVEFKSREYLKQYPVFTMIGYGTHNQPPGTWSDDSSLTFCLAESLCNGFDIYDIAEKFVRWYDTGYWTPYGNVFDIGGTTLTAISRLKAGIHPLEAGPNGERSNGNGSLMRILPLAFYLENKTIKEQFELTHQVSRITHGHLRSQMACGIYIQVAINLMKGDRPQQAYQKMKQTVIDYYSIPPYNKELRHFEAILEDDIFQFSENEIYSTGYVIDTLEAALWTFLNNDSFSNTVLAAVNLGEDTDTVAAVAGGLAGMYYGYKNIPKVWINKLTRANDIINLAQRLYEAVYEKNN